MSNKRVFYALESAGLAPDGTNSFVAIHGLQSAGITTTFNLEQAFELGQISIYQNIENIPDIEVTLEKVLDGYPLLFHLATNGALTGTLVGRSNVKTTLGFSIFADTLTSATGAPIAQMTNSGMFPSASTFTFPVDGNCTESLTLIGQSSIWTTGAATFSGVFNNLDAPLASGGIQRRQHVVFAPATGPGTAANPAPPAAALDANGMTNQWMTVLPTEIAGVTSSGTIPMSADGTYPVPVQSIAVSVNFGRDNIFELGRKSYYHKYVTFPVQIRTDIDVIATGLPVVSADDIGGHNGAPLGSNLKNQTIRVRTQDGTMVDLGVENKLQSVTWTGGDATAGGNNVTNRYSYITFNDYTVTHPMDPSGL